MRPVPRPKYIATGAIFVAVAAAYAAMSFHDYRLSDTQVYMASAALKQHDPNLYPCDGLFGQGGIWRSHTPVVQRIVDAILLSSDYHDAYLPFRCMVGVATLIYLLGMYALLYRQSLSWASATFTAVLSSAVIYTIGRSYLGVGSLASITPWTLALVFSPPLVLLYLKRKDNWKGLLLVFFLVGLAGNLHLVLGVNLAMVLVLTYLASNRLSRQACLRSLAMAGLAALGALPSIIYYAVLRNGTGGDSTPTWATCYSAFRIGDLSVFYPKLLENIFNWGLTAAILLWVPVVALISQTHRFRIREGRTWAVFSAMTLVVGLVLHGLSQVLAIAMDKLPPVIDFFQACTLLMIPVFVLFAQGLVSIFRLIHGHRLLLGCGCAIVMAAWMVPSENLRVARNSVLDTVTMYMPDADRPRAAQRHYENYARFEEIASIGRYARERTPTTAVFVTDQTEFRMWGRRSVVACPDDARYVYYLAPRRLEPWLQLVQRQRDLLRPKAGRADAALLADFITEMSLQRQFAPASEWFVILDAEEAPDAPGPFEIIDGDWGQYFRLYRLMGGPSGIEKRTTTKDTKESTR